MEENRFQTPENSLHGPQKHKHINSVPRRGCSYDVESSKLYRVHRRVYMTSLNYTVYRVSILHSIYKLGGQEIDNSLKPLDAIKHALDRSATFSVVEVIVIVAINGQKERVTIDVGETGRRQLLSIIYSSTHASQRISSKQSCKVRGFDDSLILRRHRLFKCLFSGGFGRDGC